VTGGAGEMGKARLAGIGLVFLWFFIGGIAHFVFTAAEARIVPPYIPWPPCCG